MPEIYNTICTTTLQNDTARSIEIHCYPSTNVILLRLFAVPSLFSFENVFNSDANTKNHLLIFYEKCFVISSKQYILKSLLASLQFFVPRISTVIDPRIKNFGIS